MQLSVLLVALSTGLLSINDDRTRMAGTLFFPIAIFFVIYAVLLYLWRIRSLLIHGTGGESRRFDEPYGPTFFGICVAGALIATLLLVWVPLNAYQGPPLGISYIESDVCKSIVSGRSALRFEVPTSMTLGATQSIWFSLSHRIYSQSATGDLVLAGAFPGKDALQSITYIPSNVLDQEQHLLLAGTQGNVSICDVKGTLLVGCRAFPGVPPTSTIAFNAGDLFLETTSSFGKRSDKSFPPRK